MASSEGGNVLHSASDEERRASSSPRPKSRRREGSPERVDWSVADTLFLKFFRVAPDATSVDPSQLDSLSLLACARQGVLPQELLPVAKAGAKGDAVLPGILDVVQQAEAERRRAKFDIVERERKYLRGMVSTAAKMTRLSHELENVRKDLLLQCESSSGGVVCSCDEDELADIQLLIEHTHSLAPERERLQRLIENTRAKGEEEVKKLRKRNLHLVAHDMRLEAERREMLRHIEERELAYRRLRLEKERELEERARREDKIHRRKIRALQMRSRMVSEQQAAILRERAAKQEIMWRTLQQQREAELAQRRAESAKRDEEAKQRADRVRKSLEHRRALLEHQQLDEAVTHEERRETLRMQLEVSREQRQLAALRRFYAAKQHVEQSSARNAAEEQELKELEREAAERLEAIQRDHQARLEAQRRAREEKARLTEERRAAVAEARARMNIKLLTHQIEMERNVRAAQEARLEQVQLHSALHRGKFEHVMDNLTRLERQHEHKYQQKQALLREAEERDRAKAALRSEMTAKLQVTRQRLAQQREVVQQQVRQLRNARDLLQKSPEEFLDASLRRASPRPTRATRSADGNRPITLPCPRQGPDSPPGVGDPPLRKPSTDTPSAAVEAAARRRSS